MKNLFSLICIIFITTISYGQQLEILKKSLDSLTNLKKNYQQKMLEIDKEYSRINAIYKSEQVASQSKPDVSLDSTTIAVSYNKIYKHPSDLNEIGIIRAGDKVKVIGQQTVTYATNYTASFYEISFDNIVGWVLKETLMPIAEYQKKLKLAEERKNTALKAVANRKADLIKRYGATDAQGILEHKFWIGMTDKMAKESLGNPDDINRSVGSWGVHEQWVYGDTYLYFENSILTSYQN